MDNFWNCRNTAVHTSDAAWKCVQRRRRGRRLRRRRWELVGWANMRRRRLKVITGTTLSKHGTNKNNFIRNYTISESILIHFENILLQNVQKSLNPLSLRPTFVELTPCVEWHPLPLPSLIASNSTSLQRFPVREQEQNCPIFELLPYPVGRKKETFVCRIHPQKSRKKAVGSGEETEEERGQKTIFAISYPPSSSFLPP